MKFGLENYKNIHLIGIGGASMYAIAALLHHDGKVVTGSDIAETDNTLFLKKLGINNNRYGSWWREGRRQDHGCGNSGGNR